MMAFYEAKFVQALELLPPERRLKRKVEVTQLLHGRQVAGAHGGLESPVIPQMNLRCRVDPTVTFLWRFFSTVAVFVATSRGPIGANRHRVCTVSDRQPCARRSETSGTYARPRAHVDRMSEYSLGRRSPSSASSFLGSSCVRETR